VVGAINLHRGLAPPSCWSCRAHTVRAVLPHTALRHRSPAGIRSRGSDGSGQAVGEERALLLPHRRPAARLGSPASAESPQLRHRVRRRRALRVRAPRGCWPRGLQAPARVTHLSQVTLSSFARMVARRGRPRASIAPCVALDLLGAARVDPAIPGASSSDSLGLRAHDA